MAALRNASRSSPSPAARTMNAPANAVGSDPTISQVAMPRCGDPSRQCTAAPVDLLTAAATRSFATADVGGTPRKISAGVISAPPPMPVRPMTMPMPKLVTSSAMTSAVTWRPGTTAATDSIALVGREPAAADEVREDLVEHLIDRAIGGVEGEVGVGGGLVGRRDAGEVLDLAAPRLRVQALAVAALALLERRGHVDQHERGPDVVGHRARRLARAVERGDGAADGQAAVPGDLGGDPADALDVRLAVLAGEREPSRQVAPDDVAVEQRHRAATGLDEAVAERLRQRRLAAAGQAGEEDDDALLEPERTVLGDDGLDRLAQRAVADRPVDQLAGRVGGHHLRRKARSRVSLCRDGGRHGDDEGVVEVGGGRDRRPDEPGRRHARAASRRRRARGTGADGRRTRG